LKRASTVSLGTWHLALLRGAAMIVPAERREEWYLEWSSELFYARDLRQPAAGFSWTAAWELTAFCLGSFQDAAYLREIRWTDSTRFSGSARQCLARLCVLLACCACIGRLLPGIRSEEYAARTYLTSGAIFIERDPVEDGRDRSIPFAAYKNWKAGRQRFFTKMAFYWPERLQADGVSGDHVWIAGHASADFFAVLGIESLEGVASGATDAKVAEVILSQSTWRQTFGADPRLIGDVVSLANRRVRIAGIAPDGSWQLPNKPDFWVLQPGESMERNSEHRSGYVVALLTPDGQAQMTNGSVRIDALDENRDRLELRGMQFESPTSGSSAIYFFSLFLAFLALPAVTSVFDSESNFVSHPRSFAARSRCWVFLGVKFILVASLGYFGALDMAYCGFVEFSRSAEFLELLASFGICLFGLRWALVDQSRRCPVCLRLVTHPTQVGIASCNFLSWSGTEMVCMGGHALLHVPNLPTSWFSQPRWIYLDTSWYFLFTE